MKKIIFILLLIHAFCYAQNPSLKWAQSFISSGEDFGLSVAHDKEGSLYTTGFYRNTIDFDPGPGVYTLTVPTGTLGFFILKLDSSGQFVWLKTIESSGNAVGHSIKLDAIGNIYTTGSFDSACDFDPGPSSYSLSPSGNPSSFILKLDPAGNFIWAKSINSNITCLSLDASKNVFTTGVFTGSVDFDPGIGTSSLSSVTSDAFVSKLDSNGTFVWAKSISGNNTGNNNCYSSSITNDDLGNVYTTGWFIGTCDFDPSSVTYNLNTGSFSFQAVFVSKLDASGNFVWAKKLAGDASGITAGNSIVVDSQNNVYTTGTFQGTDDFDPGPATYTLAGGRFFLSKLDATGNFVWAKGIAGLIYGKTMGVDNNDNVYVSGGFGPSTLMPFLGFNLVGNLYNESMFISKFNSLGNLLWAGSVAGGCTTKALSMSIDITGNLYITGQACGGPIDFDPDIGTYTLNIGGGGDIFILKMSACCSTIGMKENINYNPVCVFPNPAINSFKIQISAPIKNGDIVLINSLGEKIYSQKISSGENEIPIKNVSPGLYHYIISENGQGFNYGKIIIK